jgi:hypothetical protein
LKSGSVLEVFGDFESVTEELQKSVKASMRRELESDSASAKAALERDQDQLSNFLNVTVSVPSTNFLGTTVEALRSLTVSSISNVLVHPFPSERSQDTDVQISFVAQVILHETIKTYSSPEGATELRVGETRPPTLGSGYSFGVLEVKDVDVPASYIVEAEAHLLGHEYVSFRYVSAKSRGAFELRSGTLASIQGFK